VCHCVLWYIRTNFQGNLLPVSVLIMVKVKAVPLHAKHAHRGGRGIVLPILIFGTGRGLWSAPHPGCFTPGKETWYTLYRSWEWASGLDWIGVENLASTRV
jgi:hypothetical protein